jgi:DNA repair protein RecN (Recombination protein N)
MLHELHIKNFVLIDELHLDFSQGFNVLTGETGAGKSIIVDALNLLLGQRARGDIIRPGSEEASVEAVFDQFDGRSAKRLEKRLRKYGLEPDPEGLFIKRTIKRDGRGRCYINSSPTQLKVLDKIGNLLVDVHGQHEHQSLLHGEVYIDLLDAFAGKEKEADELRDLFSRLREVEQEIENLEEAQRERRRQEDLLKFQIEEIEQAQLTPGEEEPLEQERLLLKHSGQLAENAQVVQGLLVEGLEERPPVLDGLSEVQRRIEEMAEVDSRLEGLSRDLSASLIQIEEIGREVASYSTEIESNPQRLEEVEDRLHMLKRLKSKYGATLEDVLQYLEDTSKHVAELEGADETLAKLNNQRLDLAREFIQDALALSQERQKAAVRLSRAVTRELKDLGLEEGQFMVQVDAVGESGFTIQMEGKSYRASSHGIDRVEFLVRTNPGQDAGPLRQIASGGELSRMALAIKTVLGKVDRVATLFFDEIDTGIGGNIAEVVAAKFQQVAQDRQIICITHLPQIAGKADRNFRVSKLSDGEQTQTQVNHLEGEQLVREIARMLGNEESEDSQRFARKLIQE